MLDYISAASDGFLTVVDEAAQLPFVSVDQYPVHYKDGRLDQDWFVMLNSVLGHCLRTGQVPWLFMQGPSPDVDTGVVSPGIIKLETHTNLAYGAKCLQYWRWQLAHVEQGDEKNINFRIHRLASFFLQGKYAGRLWHIVPDGKPMMRSTFGCPAAENVSVLGPAGGDNAAIICSRWGYQGKEFLILVNRDWTSPTAFTVSIGGDVVVALYEPFPGSDSPSGGVIAHGAVRTLPPGEMEIWVWT